MTEVRAAVIDLEPTEKPLALRLGTAVLLQWSNLPTTAQDLLRRQAALAETDEDTSVQMTEQISALLRKHAVGFH